MSHLCISWSIAPMNLLVDIWHHAERHCQKESESRASELCSSDSCVCGCWWLFKMMPLVRLWSLVQRLKTERERMRDLLATKNRVIWIIWQCWISLGHAMQYDLSPITKFSNQPPRHSDKNEFLRDSFPSSVKSSHTGWLLALKEPQRYFSLYLSQEKDRFVFNHIYALWC